MILYEKFLFMQFFFSLHCEVENLLLLCVYCYLVILEVHELAFPALPLQTVAFVNDYCILCLPHSHCCCCFALKGVCE